MPQKVDNANTEPSVSQEEIERHKLQQEKEYLSPREMAAYIISGVGDKNWETFNGDNEFFYTTTFLHANPITLSVAKSVSAILDTFDNAISGPILDRTSTRWGRVRPYLVLTLPFWLFSAIMPYALPDGLSQVALLIWFLVIRYVESISNSFYTPAYQAVLYNLTPNVNERNRLIATDTYVDLLGAWLPSIFPFLVDYLPRTIPTKKYLSCRRGVLHNFSGDFQNFRFFLFARACTARFTRGNEKRKRMEVGKTSCNMPTYVGVTC